MILWKKPSRWSRFKLSNITKFHFNSFLYSKRLWRNGVIPRNSAENLSRIYIMRWMSSAFGLQNIIYNLWGYSLPSVTLQTSSCLLLSRASASKCIIWHPFWLVMRKYLCLLTMECGFCLLTSLTLQWRRKDDNHHIPFEPGISWTLRSHSYGRIFDTDEHWQSRYQPKWVWIEITVSIIIFNLIRCS